MRALILQHVHFEHEGTLAECLHARDIEADYIFAPMEKIEPSGLDGADLLVVLGGPIGVGDLAIYPFLKDELSLIEKALHEGTPILGICLGAQLIAHALGARVYPSGLKEIGWGGVELTEAGLSSPLCALQDVSVLHWHGDTFDLPQGASHLARTALIENQAFSWGQQVLGLQFHAEVMPEEIEAWLVGHACELAAAGISPQTIREDAARVGQKLKKAAKQVFTEWLDGALET